MYSVLYRKQKKAEEVAKGAKCGKRAKQQNAIDSEPSLDEPLDDEDIVQLENDIIDYNLMVEQSDLADAEAMIDHDEPKEEKNHPFQVIF